MADQPKPNWYDDGQGQERWWDGRGWTDYTRPTLAASRNHSLEGGNPVTAVTPTAGAEHATGRHRGASVGFDRESDVVTTEWSLGSGPKVDAAADLAAPLEATAPVTPAPPVKEPKQPVAEPVLESVPRFGARRFALSILERLRAVEMERARLAEVVDRLGLASLVELEQTRSRLQVQVEDEQSRLVAAVAETRAARQELASLQKEVIDVRAALEVQDLGLFDFEHPAESSAVLATELESVRAQIKTMNASKTAALAESGFMFNNSEAKGRKFVSDMTKILLRAYNAEAENCVKTTKAGNLYVAQRRLSTASDQIERQGSMISLRISPKYHALRLQEIELANRHLQALQREKELERERREALREQRKVELELQRERARLEKEHQQYLNTIAALRANGDLDGVARMQAKIDDVLRAIEDVDYREANARAGYVYVISNVGSFGDGIVKIGMTRRLEPMERVNELGDASVPFRFDVHALFFADDAVGIEAMLHRTFAKDRVNQINHRREFFYCEPEQVLEVLKEHSVELVEFTTTAEAAEFRSSQEMRVALAR